MLLIQNGRVIDPANGVDETLDILTANGTIATLGHTVTPPEGARVIDAHGLVVCPGLVDVHVHFRDPGFPEKEDLLSGAQAAAAGGFTTVVCMANTKPAADSPEVIDYILKKASVAPVRVRTVGAVTKGLAGRELADLPLLAAHGVCGFSDDGAPLTDERLLLRAFALAAELDLPVSLHEEHPALVEQSGVNAGQAARALGLVGAFSAAEDIMTARDCMLALHTNARVNIQHISSKNAVELVRAAKKLGARVTAEATPHHFSLTEQAVQAHGTLAKVNPPLRTEQDRTAIIEGLCDGTLSIIATDHAPHTAAEKARPFTEAPSGMIGLETALALGITELVQKGFLTLPELIGRMSTNPAALYGFDAGTLSPGAPADITIVDPARAFTAGGYRSKSTNTPFTGRTLYGAVRWTICGGRVVFEGA